MSKWNIWHCICDSNEMHCVSVHDNEQSALVGLHILATALGTVVVLDSEFEKYYGSDDPNTPVWAWCVIDYNGNKFIIMEEGVL